AENDEKWAKIPVSKVRRELKTISNRGVAPFVALKIYLTLISQRYKEQATVRLTHESIRASTGVQTTQVRKGLDVLYCSSLMHLEPTETRGCHEYHILGL
ncbi:hypothetical protein LRP52_48510, partial [Photobacterium sp. ZSDE20]|nr:hypothetical protein [Photobacterium sp. ZSDE20]